jgi:signal peptidase I
MIETQVIVILIFLMLLSTFVDGLILHWLGKYWNGNRTLKQTMKIILYSIAITIVLIAAMLLFIATRNPLIFIVFAVSLILVIVGPWQFIRKHYHLSHGRSFLLLISWVILSSIVSSVADKVLDPTIGNIVSPFQVIGSANEPQLSSDDYILTSSFYYKVSEPQRGDIIVFKAHLGDGFIQRIIGLPGEKIELKGGKVFVDSQALNEPYIPEGLATCKSIESTCPDENELYEIPENGYFILGDNRAHSYDSRFWNNDNEEWIPYLDRSNIIGKAVARVYPKVNWIE